jgi:hypothetical protein
MLENRFPVCQKTFDFGTLALAIRQMLCETYSPKVAYDFLLARRVSPLPRVKRYECGVFCVRLP